MSVLIKGMEMPKNCGECQFCHAENFATYCCPTDRDDILYDAIPEWCPLVQMPHITDEQISDAFQVAIASYWEQKSKSLTPPPVPCCADTRKSCEDAPKSQNEFIEDVRSMVCKVNDYYGYTDSMHMFKVLFDQKYHGWVEKRGEAND